MPALTPLKILLLLIVAGFLGAKNDIILRDLVGICGTEKPPVSMMVEE